MLRRIVLGLVLILAVSACNLERGAESHGFHKLTFQQALARAKSEKKPLMIDFHANWCGPCKMLDSETFSNNKVQSFLTEKTIAIRVNIDNNPALAAQYNVTTIPRILFLDAEAKELGTMRGFMPAQEFLREAGKIVH